MSTEIATNTIDGRKPSATANGAEIPFYLGIPVSLGAPACPMMQRSCTCQVQQSNGIWVTVIDD